MLGVNLILESRKLSHTQCHPKHTASASGAHLLGGQAKIVGEHLPVAEAARLVVDDVLVVQLVVLVQVLLKALLI